MSVMIEMVIFALSGLVAPSHVWPFEHYNKPNATLKVPFKNCVALRKLNVNSSMKLVTS